MNFYPLWYCRMSGSSLDERYRERLRSYLDTVQHLFAPNGSPLHQGRSLTYRFAATAPFWAGALFDATPLPPGRTRRLASACLRYFHGAGSWDEHGLQRIGWHGEFEPIRQPYSGPGSPYWSSKAFAGLVLPPGHPVWTEREQPLEVEERDVELCVRATGWLVSGTKKDGVIRVFNHGTDHQPDDRFGADDPGYGRHAYSTHTGPGYDRQAWHAPVDNHVALIDSAGNVSHRRPLTPVSIGERVAVSRHRAHWIDGTLPDAFVWPPREASFIAGPLITTASIVRGATEVRLVRVEEDTDCVLRVGGFQVADDRLTSVVIGLRGLPESGTLATDGADAFGPQSTVPFVQSDGPAVRGEIYAAAITLTGADLPPWQLRVEVDADLVTVLWPDGNRETVKL
jgi:hypothetical protein